MVEQQVGRQGETTMWRSTWTVLVVGMFALLGCGGDDAPSSAGVPASDSGDSGTGGGADQPTEPGDGSSGDQDDEGAAGAVALIVVGDRSYEMVAVEPSPLCFSGADGSMTVQAATADWDVAAKTGAALYALIQPNDWEPPEEGETGFFPKPRIVVDDLATDESFVAETDFFAGFVSAEDSGVLESDLGEGRAEGSARFVEGSQATSQETPISYEGTFDVDCGN